MGIIQCITDRTRAEQEIAEAKRFAESIVNTMQESLVVLDSQLRVISANRSFYETSKTTAGGYLLSRRRQSFCGSTSQLVDGEGVALAAGNIAFQKSCDYEIAALRSR